MPLKIHADQIQQVLPRLARLNNAELSSVWAANHTALARAINEDEVNPLKVGLEAIKMELDRRLPPPPEERTGRDQF
ncbi:hypothetical protein [Azospirillum rugosum]|uniref:Uncharacterized protein n=1 Tax=Azospirillum rugosum TaxID=416170 RepID=A0ABS4SKB3_9PROT|nr:hypothetical protein [Azospirillum rugosum]MBP2292991.1 hypothetical protein [Azospirillum rugosum]MDQ0526540.1 hypothetical protein [Azospirillum rugosum]